MVFQKFVVAIVMGILIIGCSSSKKVRETNSDLDAMMAEKRMEFKAISAQPMMTNAMSQIGQSGLFPPGSNVARIDLNGANNFLKITGDSVSANLSYYGERQMGGGYNSTTGIKFNGVPKALKIEKDEIKKTYSMTFQIREKMETFIVRMLVNPNLTSSVNIVSSHRTRIGYTGTAGTVSDGK